MAPLTNPRKSTGGKAPREKLPPLIYGSRKSNLSTDAVPSSSTPLTTNAEKPDDDTPATTPNNETNRTH
ncbi:hypothetical protein BN14_08418 [Rhizoctonia solani AG-1 IB]|uniref:Uncharacterized protein n=1 Tax=Thanatephorus cucumeris (strain AG1-IB / isolate 7/3/14) TaxID=1108050 RepID=M5C4H9_THACB|nr:hypothetical protein BN14_08418 [Rhizoctonia solani AG-1 IB]